MRSLTLKVPQNLNGLEMPTGHKLCNTVGEDGKSRCADIINFRNGTLIQRIGEYIVTGDEDWFCDEKDGTYYFYCPHKYYEDLPIGGHQDTMLCTHFRWIAEARKPFYGEFMGGDKNEIKFNYDEGRGGTKAFKKWLKTQVTSDISFKIVYILDKPIVKYLDFDCCLEYYKINNMLLSECEDVI